MRIRLSSRSVGAASYRFVMTTLPLNVERSRMALPSP